MGLAFREIDYTVDTIGNYSILLRARNGSLLSNVLFEKEVISHSILKKLHLKSFIMRLKAHKVMQQVFFSVPILLQIQ